MNDIIVNVWVWRLASNKIHITFAYDFYSITGFSPGVVMLLRLSDLDYFAIVQYLC